MQEQKNKDENNLSISELVKLPKDPTTMIFVPSKGGHSHCELEYSPVEWCWKGANVLLNTILEIDKK